MCMLESLKRDDRFAARNTIMDDQTEAGLPGPCHKLAATGRFRPCERYSRQSIIYIFIY